MPSWGCRLDFHFPIVKLWDYNERREWLEGQDNPFATVALAHLETRRTRNRHRDRLRAKMALLRRLYERGDDPKTILELFRFIDWLMALPAELEANFQQQLKGLEKEMSMRYVTSIERLGIQKGLEQGIERGLQRGMQQGIERGMQQGIERGMQQGLRQGRSHLLHRMLTRRFNPLPAWVDDRLEGADPEQLELWADRLMEASKIEEVFAD